MHLPHCPPYSFSFHARAATTSGGTSSSSRSHSSSSLGGALDEGAWLRLSRMYLAPGLARRVFRRLLAGSRCVFVLDLGGAVVFFIGGRGQGRAHTRTRKRLVPLNTLIHTHCRYGGAEAAHALPLADFAAFLCLVSRGSVQERLRFVFDVRLWWFL